MEVVAGDDNFFMNNLIFDKCNGGADGDPHIKPWDGKRYYFMGECDAVMHSLSLLDVHIRTTIKDFYSYIEAAAIRVGESIVGNECR